MLLRKLATMFLRTPKDVRRSILLLVMMFGAAILEAVGIGLVMPFLALIQNPRIADTSRALQLFRHVVGAETDLGTIRAVGISLAGLFVVKSLYLSFVQWAEFRFIFGRQTALASYLFERYLGNEYSFHLQHNSTELINNVVYDLRVITSSALVSLFMIAVEVLTVLVILVCLVAIEPLLIPIAGLSTGLVAVVMYRTVQRRNAELGRQEQAYTAEMIKWIQQGLGGIKEAQVIGVESFFLAAFRRGVTGLGRVSAEHQTLQAIPRYTLETLGVIALVAVALVKISHGASPEAILPVLGVLAVAAIRMLPSVARILQGMSMIRHCTPAVDSIFSAISAPHPFHQLAATRLTPLTFAKELRMVDVAYRYPGAAQPSLSDVSLTIRRGESIAFVGGSGAGKTTIADVLIGLLEPTSGRLEVDGERLAGLSLVAWRRGIGYIPQQVYLCDDSILRNIAFGLEDAQIDRGRVDKAVETARLRELVDSLPEGLDTFIGERGVRLSGGQRQRIGIARALYLDPQVLVLDEATSSLDGTTEQEVVEAIERIRTERTAIIIAHRLSTVRSCDRLVFMKAGRIVQIGSWDALCAQNADFRHLVQLARGDHEGDVAGDAGRSRVGVSIAPPSPPQT